MYDRMDLRALHEAFEARRRVRRMVSWVAVGVITLLLVVAGAVLAQPRQSAATFTVLHREAVAQRKWGEGTWGAERFGAPPPAVRVVAEGSELPEEPPAAPPRTFEPTPEEVAAFQAELAKDKEATSEISADVQKSKEAFGAGKTLLGILLIMGAAVKGMRAFGRKLPGKAGEFFASPAATWALPIGISVIGWSTHTLATGGTITFGALIGEALFGAIIGGWGAANAARVEVAKAIGIEAPNTIKTKKQLVAAINNIP